MGTSLARRTRGRVYRTGETYEEAYEWVLRQYRDGIRPRDPRVIKPDAKPILGEKARAVARKAAKRGGLTPEETKLLILIAAYRDGGEEGPSIKYICQRMGLDVSRDERTASVQKIEALLRSLGSKKMIFVNWGRGEDRGNTYVLSCLGEQFELPKRAAA